MSDHNVSDMIWTLQYWSTNIVIFFQHFQYYQHEYNKHAIVDFQYYEPLADNDMNLTF